MPGAGGLLEWKSSVGAPFCGDKRSQFSKLKTEIVDQIPSVRQCLSVPDYPDIQSILVADDRDVECETVKHDTHRVVRQERGSIASQLDARSRHVRDDQVHRRTNET